MIKAVFDSNILISAFIAKSYPRKALESVLDGRVLLITSNELIMEFEDVISRKKFGFSEKQRNKMVSIVRRAGKVVIPKQKLKIILEDPDDNIILECAKEGEAEYIVTGDRHLLGMKKWEGIGIVTAREFVETLEK